MEGGWFKWDSYDGVIYLEWENDPVEVDKFEGVFLKKEEKDVREVILYPDQT